MTTLIRPWTDSRAFATCDACRADPPALHAFRVELADAGGRSSALDIRAAIGPHDAKRQALDLAAAAGVTDVEVVDVRHVPADTVWHAAGYGGTPATALADRFLDADR